jgi:phosphomannomutase/phosphoglucomutase
LRVKENGGIIYGKHQFCRDGAMTMALMLNLLTHEGKTVSELLKEIPDYSMVKSSVARTKDWEEIKKLLSEKFSGKKMDFTDGIKIYDLKGWTLIRPSGTEKIIRIFSESTSKSTAEEYNKIYVDFLANL